MGQRLKTFSKLLGAVSLATSLAAWPVGPVALAPAQAAATLPTPAYQAAPLTQNAFPRLLRGQAYHFSITLQNTGTASWQKDVVHLGTDRPQDRVPSFVREGPAGTESGWIAPNRAQMVETTVAPGANGIFEFWYTVPSTMPDGLYREYFNLVADGITWFNDLGIYWDIAVDNRPHSAWVEQNANPPTLYAGDSYEFEVVFRNTGLLPWRPDGPTPVHLGTDRGQDRIPGFVREGPAGTGSGWVKGNRVELARDETGNLSGDLNLNGEIDAGEIARFTFWYTIPATMESGTYREYFRPVMDFAPEGWMEDDGVYWQITVDNIAPRPAKFSVTPFVNHLNLVWSSVEEATSYRVRYRAVDGSFAYLDFPSTVTEANIDVIGGQDFEVGVASLDAEGISPFTTGFIHVESPAERSARLERETRLEEQRRLAEQPTAAEPSPAPSEPTVTGAPPSEEESRDWRQFWLTLLVLLGAAGLATAGYYGYEWWLEERPRRRPPVVRQRPTPPPPPKRAQKPRPPQRPTPPPTRRW